MVIEVRRHFRWLVRTWVALLAGAFWLCAGAQGQPPAVTTGSVITIPSSTTWGQIYKILFYNGNVLALDTGNSALYQLAPGATSWTTIVSGGPLGNSGSFNSEGMTIDAQGTIYVDIRYPNSASPNSLFWRVPYSASQNTWNFTTSTGWGSNIEDPVTGSDIVTEGGSDDVEFVDSPQKDGSGTLYWMAENPNDIYSVTVDNTGNADQPNGVTATLIVAGLKANQGKLAIDVNGDVYFTENHATKATSRVGGIFLITPDNYGNSGNANGSAEAQLVQVDPGNTVQYAGVTLDANGDLYLISEQNSSYGETTAGTWMIPNECGSPSAVGDSCIPNFADISMVSPVSGNNAIAIDPRGYLWIPTYQDWTPPGSGPWPNLFGIVLWAPGSLNLGPAPIGTPSATASAGTLFVTFNTPVTPSAIQLSQPGTGSDFTVTSTNPDPPAAGTTPVAPCTVATAYAAQTSCPYWIQLSARAPGGISGQFTMQGAVGSSTTNVPIPSATAYVTGTGQAAEASLLTFPVQTAVAAGLDTPAQVASDPLGDVYVADPGLHKVLYFSANSSGASGTPIGKSLTAPTGVAVDGSGDVYIADSGNVIEIPWVNGALDTAGQTIVAKGLGGNLNLAADGIGNVFVADPENARVLRVPSPDTAGLIPVFTSTTLTVGSGFTKPSAVAEDTAGNLYVADGSDLYEITPPYEVQTEIANSLSGPVTGLAVDASGSVDVAQSGGILHIPSIGGVLSINSAGPLDTSITAPNSVALDQQGNLYVSDMTGGTPNLFELSVNGFVDFGEGLSPTVLAEQDVPVFNIGNEPLNMTATPTFSGPDAADFSITSPSGGTPCDFTGTNAVNTGASCNVGAGFTPPAPPPGDTAPITYSGDTMTVPTTGANVASGTLTAALQATALAGLEATQTSVSLSPPGSSYPGSTTATVNITPEPSDGIDYVNSVPSGTVTLTLANAAAGSTQPPIVQTCQAAGTNSGTSCSVSLTAIPGGTYNVTAAYGGNLGQLFQKSNSDSSPVTFIVATAVPTVTLSEPLGIQPNSQNGIYYVQQGGATTLTANVSSPLGTPTGTVTFMNGSTVVGSATPDANGNAIFAVKDLPAGTYNLTAVYGGDQNFSSGQSAVITFQLIPGSVLITANPASISTTAGTPVASTLTLQSLVGFAATNGVNITCDPTTMPYYSECTFSVPQPDICAPSPNSSCTGTTTTVVTISSNIPVNVPPTASNVPLKRPGSSPLYLAGLLGLGLFSFMLRRRAVFNRYLLNLVFLALTLTAAMVGVASCTNSSYTKTPPLTKVVTPSGTYNVSIYVSSPGSTGSESLPFTLTLKVN